VKNIFSFMRKKPKLAIGGIEAWLSITANCPNCKILLGVKYCVSHGLKSSEDIVIRKTTITCPKCSKPFDLNNNGEVVG